MDTKYYLNVTGGNGTGTISVKAAGNTNYKASAVKKVKVSIVVK